MADEPKGEPLDFMADHAPEAPEEKEAGPVKMEAMKKCAEEIFAHQVKMDDHAAKGAVLAAEQQVLFKGALKVRDALGLKNKVCEFGEGKLTFNEKFSASQIKEEKPNFMKWMRDNGYEKMIKIQEPKVEPSTLKALCVELMGDGNPIPDGVKTSTFMVVTAKLNK